MNYKIVSTFQDRLIELIKISKLNQKDFSEKAQLSKSLINRYIHRGDNPKGDRIVQIANNFNVNPLWLMGCDIQINAVVIPQNVVYNIPIIKDITSEQIFSIKNYDGVCSNILDLDINYQYFYYEHNGKRYLIQIKEKYNDNDIVVAIKNDIFTIGERNDLDKYKIIGKLISILYK